MGSPSARKVIHVVESVEGNDRELRGRGVKTVRFTSSFPMTTTRLTAKIPMNCRDQVSQSLAIQACVSAAPDIRSEKVEVTAPNKSDLAVIGGVQGNLEKKSREIPLPEEAVPSMRND